jgi:aspartate aminotransferase
MVTERLAGRVGACRDILWGRRSGGRSGRSMFDQEVISFAHGNGLRGPEPAVVAAGIEALLDPSGFPLERYNFLERYEPLDEAIHTTMLREGFPMEHLDLVCIDAGTSRLFASFLSTVTEPGDVVLTAPAFYHGLVGWCHLLKLGMQIAPATAADAYKLNAANLDAARCEQQLRGARPPRVVVVFNPTPSGAIYTTDELRDVGDFCHEHDLVAIEDNVFARTRYEPYSSIAHLADDERMRGRVVSVDGCSKADGLANLRIGWAIGPPQLIKPMEQIKLATTVSLPYVVQVMAETALRLEWAARPRGAAACRERAALVSSSIAEVNERLDLPDDAGLRVVHPPRAGHSIMVDGGALATLGGRRAPFSNSLHLAEDWLDRAAVAVSPLYSGGLDGHELRLNFASIDRTAVPDGGRRGAPAPAAAGAASAEPAVLIREGLVRRLAGALHPRALRPRRVRRVVVRPMSPHPVSHPVPHPSTHPPTHRQPRPHKLPTAAVG